MNSSRIYCHSCNSKFLIELSGFQSVWLKKCSVCGLVFDCRNPSVEELDKHYHNYSYSTLKPCPDATVRSFEHLLNSFKDFYINGRILDIGCGQGDFLFTAKTHGWHTFGSEYSDAAINLCINRGIEVIKEPLTRDSFGGKKFDVITSFEVIEHIQTPNKLFNNVKSLLRPGGLFYLTTPNFDSILRYLEGHRFEMLGYPEHLCFYNKKSIRCLALKHKFKPSRITTTGIDLARIKKYLPQKEKAKSEADQENLLSRKEQTDLMRNKINTNSALLISKNLTNKFLGWTGSGDTLKAWLVNDSNIKDDLE